MADAYTSNKLGLIEPASGAYSGTWDLPLYANWQTIDAAMGGTTNIVLSSSNVTLTIPTYPTNANPPSVSTSAQNLRLYLTGTLSANVTVFLPATVGGFWIVDDATTGSFTVTIKTTSVGSSGVSTVQGKSIIVVSTGTNVKLADSGNNFVDVTYLTPVGTIIASARTTAPTGYLVCDGAAVSRTNYAALYAAIGTTWGVGDNVTTFNIPDLSNMFLRGSGSSAVGVYEADDIKSHTHAINDPGHVHGIPQGTRAGGDTGLYTSGDDYTNNVYGYPDSQSATTGITNQSTGGTETRPMNKRVLYCIKY